MDREEVIYIQCPHCHSGWYGKLLDVNVHEDKLGNQYLDHLVVSGINPTDLTEELECLNCHEHYTPITKGKQPNRMNCLIGKMWDFVAERLITCKGH